VIELFSNFENFENSFEETKNIWNEIFKEWIIFLKQLINGYIDHHISIRLPILKFVKLICKMIIE
jgi:hypothetical protein